MPPPLIRKLSPLPVPRHRFAFTRWYRGGGLWHYQGSGFCATNRLPPGGYERIDPALRRLCRLLHGSGLATTPSCQGHFHPPEHFRGIWRMLIEEASCIRGSGLPVRDAQDGDVSLFADPDYALPWPDEEAFVRDAQSQQQEGYLGVVLPNRGQGRAEWLLSLEEVTAAELGHRTIDRGRFSLIDIHVRMVGPWEQLLAWAAITEAAAALTRS